MESVEELARKASRLNPSERVQLIEAIFSSLDPPDPAIEKHWAAEAEARYAAYKRGELKATDWEIIQRRYSD